MIESESPKAARIVREIFLAGFMSRLPPSSVAWAAARLARTITDVRAARGEILYSKGDPTDDNFFVVEGEVTLEAEDAPPYVFGEQSLIGAIDVMIGRVRSRTAVATKPSRLLRISSTDWLGMLKDNFELTRSAIEALSREVGDLRTGLQTSSPPGRSAWSPNPTRGRLGLIDRLFVLQTCPLFATSDTQALVDLARVADEVVYEAGDLVLPPGEDRDGHLLAIVSGNLRGSRLDGGAVESFAAGELLFGAASLATTPATFEAHAAERTLALRIGREDYFDIVEAHFGLARASLKAIMLEREALLHTQGRGRVS